MTAADNSVASGNTVEPTFQVGCFEVILTIVRFILFRFSLLTSLKFRPSKKKKLLLVSPKCLLSYTTNLFLAVSNS